MDEVRKLELSDLTEMERVALVALLAKVVAADREAGEDERARLAEIIEAIGPDTYDRAFETAARLFKDEDDLRVYLECIRRQDAREIIYGAVMSVALAGTVMPAEATFLDWLAQLWNVEARPLPQA